MILPDQAILREPKEFDREAKIIRNILGTTVKRFDFLLEKYE